MLVKPIELTITLLELCPKGGFIMDPRTLEDTADDLDRLAANKRAEAEDLIRLADDDETLATANRDEARRLRDEQTVAEARERDAEDALKRR